MSKLGPIFSAALLLAACSDGGSPPANQSVDSAAPLQNTASPVPAPLPAATPTPEEPTPAAPANSATGETVGGDGSQIRFLPLQPEDGDRIEGELACSFQQDGARGSILLARADVGKAARGFAVVRNAGVPETLASNAEGGFGAIEKGAIFGGKGLTVRITRQSRQETGDESTAHRAQLLVQRADGAERRFHGLWSCGP